MAVCCCDKRPSTAGQIHVFAQRGIAVRKFLSIIPLYFRCYDPHFLLHINQITFAYAFHPLFQIIPAFLCGDPVILLRHHIELVKFRQLVKLAGIERKVSVIRSFHCLNILTVLLCTFLNRYPAAAKPFFVVLDIIDFPLLSVVDDHIRG